MKNAVKNGLSSRTPCEILMNLVGLLCIIESCISVTHIRTYKIRVLLFYSMYFNCFHVCNQFRASFLSVYLHNTRLSQYFLVGQSILFAYDSFNFAHIEYCASVKASVLVLILSYS